ncbi:MAG: hydroxyacylglutathione hydrolase family protein [Acidobacteria bacterium]|jgi:glyoxylase-like metal-dependent hydrolase (beta-lactamase superfamily II)|nr:hydroxyacylglutathione hydrolase family protein [Acidobacteriota bacterium]
MIFFQIPSSGDRNYGYLVGCEKTKKAAVIDPSPKPEPCYEKANELGLSVEYVINTHTHYDHTGGNQFFQKKCNAKLITHQLAHTGDIHVNDCESLNIGEVKLTFFHTPGHTPESMCILAGNELMTGDTLFVGKVGGTSGREQAMIEFESLKKLMNLDPAIHIWPGHNYGVRPSSTIGDELKSNPFILRLNSFYDFFWLKENWAAYKLEHGIA